jgi:hypothetical protein
MNIEIEYNRIIMDRGEVEKNKSILEKYQKMKSKLMGFLFKK